MFFLSLLLTALLPFQLRAATAQNNTVPSSFKEGYSSLGTELTYISTSANYTGQGTSLDFDSEYGFSIIQTLIYGRYDFSDETSLFLELPVNYALSENTTEKFTTSKVPGLAIGLNQDLHLSSFKIIPELKGYFAFEKFDSSSSEILTSDGTNYLDAGSHFFKNFSNLQLHGFLSYQYRFDGFSGLLNYQTDISYLMESSSISFGLKGFQTITKDEYSSNPSYRHTVLSNVNGQSLLFGSVDPSRLDLFTQIKYTVSDAWDLYGGITKSIRGENSADILSFVVGLEFFPQPTTTKSSQKPTQVLEEDNFTPNEESIDSEVEEKIKTYNKPKHPALKPKPKTKPKVSKPKRTKGNGLEMSKKHLGKKTTSTSPIRSKPKSKKVKRVKIEF